MFGGPVMVVSWVVAFALAIWILGPTVGVLVGATRLDVDVDGDPARAQPRLDDPDGQLRFRQFVELGFRPLGWTQEHGRFVTPLHWRWRSLQGERWLAAPDDRTFVFFHRTVRDEPVRVGAMTLFEGGGAWITVCPGSGMDEKITGNYGRAEERRVDAAELLARHAQHVERFRAERGLAVRQATLADVAVESLAYDRATLRKSGVKALMAFPIFMFALPAAMALLFFARESSLAPFGAVSVFYAAVIYALARAFIEVSRRNGARRSHTQDFSAPRDAGVPADGEIAPGRYEPAVRAIAALAAVDMIARLVIIAVKCPMIVGLGPGTILMASVLVVLAGLELRISVARARGRVVRTGGQSKASSSWALVALLYEMMFKKPHLVWLVLVLVLAVAGWALDRARRT